MANQETFFHSGHGFVNLVPQMTKADNTLCHFSAGTICIWSSARQFGVGGAHELMKKRICEGLLRLFDCGVWAF